MALAFAIDHDSGMWSRGRVSADEPDPIDRTRAAAEALGVRVAGFVPQPCLEDWGVSAMAASRIGTGADAVTTDASFSRMYTFWANPDDKSDPVNLAALDEQTRSTLDAAPPEDLPGWITRQVKRMRYPMLREAVQTHWFADDEAFSSDPAELLRGHVDHILHNRFRDEYGLGALDEEWTELVSLSSVQPATVTIDGEASAGVMIDTDAFVFGIGAALDDRRVVTAVVDRTFLGAIRTDLLSDADHASA